jgi:predicted transposase/invertase (TIGR01784 family)
MVCGFNVFGDDKFIHRFHYADGEVILSDITCIIYVELPKIKSMVEKPFDQMTQEERWAIMIEYANDKNFSAKISDFKSKEEFDMAMNILSAVSNSELERMEYISHQKYLMDQSHNKYITQWIKEKAQEEGRQEGLQKGMEKGIKIGLLQTAKNLFAANMPIEEVSKYTGLSVDELKDLQ